MKPISAPTAAVFDLFGVIACAIPAGRVWHDPGAGHAGARTRSPGSPGPEPSQLEVTRAAQKAVALAQLSKSTWTRADLIKYLGRVLPRTGMDPAAAAALLKELTMTLGGQTRELGQWIKDLAAAHRSFADRLAER